MRALFQPSTRFMNSLGYPTKFGLIGALIAIVVGVQLAQLVRNSQADVEVARKELVGLDFLRPTWGLLEQVQTLSTMPLQAASPDDFARRIRAVDAVSTRLRETLSLSRQWTETRQYLTTLPGLDPDPRPNAIEKALASLGKLIIDAADESSLVFDSQRDSYYLVTILVVRLPALGNAVTRIDAVRRRALDSRQLTIADRSEAVALGAVLDDNLKSIQRNLAKVATSDPALPARLAELVETTGALVARTRELATKGAALSEGPDGGALARAAIGSAWRFHDALLPALQGVIEQRIADAQHRIARELAVGLGISLLLLYLLAGAWIGVVGAVRNLAAAAGRFARGELDVRVEEAARDELAEVERGFNILAESLSDRIRREEQRVAERTEELAEQMSLQSALLDNLPALVAFKDTEGRFVSVNRAYEVAFGVRREDIAGKTTLEFAEFPSEQRIRGSNQDMDVLRTGELLHHEEQLEFIDGRMHDVLLWRIPFSLEAGKPVGLISITVDVSEQKEAERAVAEQLAYQRTLIETMPNPIFVKDDEARYTGCNEAFERAFGVSRDAVIGKTVGEVFDFNVGRMEQLYQRDLELVRTRGRDFREQKLRFADGTEHDTLYWVRSIDLADGTSAGLVGAVVDVTETKALERQAQDAERRLREITNSVPGVVFQLSVSAGDITRRTYTFMSDGVRALRGFARDDALRDYRVLWDQVLDEDKPAVEQAFRTAFANETAVNQEFRIRLPDGTVKWLQAAAEQGRNSDGAIVFNGYWIDVTQHREMELELEQARVAADAANHAKSAFLAAMSHEIRTPMNGMLGMLELLSLSHLDREQRSRLEVVRESGNSLLRIINDILDFSKIEADMLDLSPEATSIADTVNAVREVYSSAASGKNLLLKTSVDPRVSPAVMVDPLRLRQILNNLVSNALKFTSVGSVEIKAELVERQTGTDIMCFAVTDTGIGVSLEQQKKLFQPFVQAESDTSRRFGGTGLGLTICRRIAELMHGSIDMESEPGRGTTMRLVLPLVAADPIDIKSDKDASPVSSATLLARRSAPSSAEAVAEGTLILVADDHATNRLTIGSQLNLLGYAAEAVEDGRQALELWQSGRFALIITDAHMPEMDGYELARAIRNIEANNGGSHIPIIACTANAMEGEADACLAAGMDAYLAKPVQLHMLLAFLDRWLPLPDGGAGQKAGDPTPVGRAITEESGDNGPIDRARLAEVSGGDEQIEREILTSFSTTLETDARHLATAIERADHNEIPRILHRMKGASRTVGAVPLTEIYERMEAGSRNDDHAAVMANHEPLLREIGRLKEFLGGF